MTNRLRFFPAFLIVLGACAGPQTRPVGFPEIKARAPASNDRAPASERMTLASLEKAPRMGNGIVVKFSVLRDSSGKFTRFYVQNPAKYEFHYQFLQTLPEFKGRSQKEIEALTYKASAHRQAWIGMLVLNDFMADSDYEDLMYRSMLYVMADDVPAPALVRQMSVEVPKLFDRDARAKFGLDKLGVQPLAQQEIEFKAKADELKGAGVWVRFRYDGARAAYSDGWGVGSVAVATTRRDLDAAIASGKIGPDTLLVLGETARELPPVAGVISSTPLTPGSHLSFLAQMYGMPVVYEKDALGKYAGLIGMPAFLSASASEATDFTFVPGLTENEVETLKAARQRPPFDIPYNDGEKTIAEARKLQPAAVSAFGGKATRFGLLRRAIPDNTRASAAGVPIYYFRKFMTSAKLANSQKDGQTLDQFVSATLATLPANPSYPQVEQAAAMIRDAIKRIQVPSDIVETIRKELSAIFKPAPQAEFRVRLRSSSNVEDGAEFNGAGLYDSESVCLSACAKKDDFERGLNKVWRSLFSARGLWARKRFNIPDNRVGMALLAHAPFKGELFNGVVRASEKIFTKSTGEFVNGEFVESKTEAKHLVFEIITQTGEEESVTNATQAGSAEVVTIDEEGQLKTSHSLKGLPPGRLAMRLEHYKTIAALMKSIVDAWPRSDKRMLDVESEWKLMPEKSAANSEKIYIKQVRQVPHPQTLFLADKSANYFVTGGRLSLTGDNLQGEAVSTLYRITSLELEIEPFTIDELNAARVRINGGTATIRGVKYPLQTEGAPALRATKFGKYLHVPMSSSIFKSIDINLEFPAEFQQPVLSAARLSFEYRVRASGISENDETDERRQGWGGWLTGDETGKREFWISDEKPALYLMKSRRAECPVSVKAAKNHVDEIIDRMSFVLDSIEIAGLLPRSIRVGGQNNYFMLRAVHDGANFIGIDLFADSTLTATERSELDGKFGRYLTGSLEESWVSGPAGKKVISNKWNFSPRLIHDDFSPGRAPPGCEAD